MRRIRIQSTTAVVEIDAFPLRPGCRLFFMIAMPGAVSIAGHIGALSSHSEHETFGSGYFFRCVACAEVVGMIADRRTVE